MPRPLDEEKSQAILRAAIAEFGEHGYASSTVQTIARGAGLSTGTVYTYFTDKETLFVAAVNLVWEDFFGDMRRIFGTQASAAEKLNQLSHMGLETLGRLYPLARGMFEHANRLDLVHHQLERLTDELLLFFRDQEAGRPADPAGPAKAGIERYNLKIWLSGILFTLATVAREEQAKEITAMEACFRQAFTNYFSRGETA